MSYAITNAKGLAGIGHPMAGRRALLGGLGATTNPLTFVDAAQAAVDAMQQLAFESSAGKIAALTLEDQNIAIEAHQFATGPGARALTKAIDNRDVAKLADLQRAMKNIHDNVRSFLPTALVARFLSFPLVGLLALSPTEITDAVRESGRQLPLPPPPQDVPWYIWVGGGALTLGTVAYMNTYDIKRSVGGIVLGAVVGLVIHEGLNKVSKKTSI